MPEILNSARPVWPSDYLFQLRKNKCFWYVTWLSLFIFCNAPPEVEIWLRTRVTEPGKTIQLRGKKKRKTSTTTVGIICHFFRWTHHHYIFHDFLVTGLKWSEICSSVFNTLLPHGPYSPWNSPGQNTGVGSLSLLKGNPGLLHCGQILYQLSYQWRCWDIILFISVFMTPGAEQVLRRFSAIISHSLNTSVWKSPTISTTFQLYCQGCSAFSHYVKKPLL